MLAAADAAGLPWTLTYGGRTASSMAFRADLLDRYPGRVRVCPQDATGLLDLPGLLGRPEPGTLVYCCGPGPLLDAAAAHCAGLARGTLHVERFTPVPAPFGPGSGGGPGSRAGLAFEVELAQAGLTLTVPPGRSILDVIEAAGVPVLSSCTEGTCGTCETAVLAGVPEHRDSVLSPAEQTAADTMMICVSRSLTPRLVLDI